MSPNEFNLDEAAVAKAEEMIFEIGSQVEAEADRAAKAIEDIVGVSWRGGAGSSALGVSNERFLPAKQKLHAELNEIGEALGLGRRATMAADEDGMASIQMVSPEVTSSFDGRLNPGG